MMSDEREGDERIEKEPVRERQLKVK